MLVPCPKAWRRASGTKVLLAILEETPLWGALIHYESKKEAIRRDGLNSFGGAICHVLGASISVTYEPL
jgi:hypothetical protein